MEPTPSQTLAANVRAELARRNLRAADLAPALGLNLGSTYSRLKGATRWNVDEIQAAADYLGIPLSALMEGVAA